MKSLLLVSGILLTSQSLYAQSLEKGEIEVIEVVGAPIKGFGLDKLPMSPFPGGTPGAGGGTPSASEANNNSTKKAKTAIAEADKDGDDNKVEAIKVVFVNAIKSFTSIFTIPTIKLLGKNTETINYQDGSSKTNTTEGCLIITAGDMTDCSQMRISQPTPGQYRVELANIMQYQSGRGAGSYYTSSDYTYIYTGTLKEIQAKLEEVLK